MTQKVVEFEGYRYTAYYTNDGRCIDGRLVDTITGAQVVVYPEHLEFILNKLSEE